MSDTHAAEVQPIEQIHQILLKPVDVAGATEQDRLSAEYLDYLQHALAATEVNDEPAEDSDKVIERQLSYVRLMSGGVHVLQVEPAMSREVAVLLTTMLSGLDDVEYAEPDFPRSRR